jgi:hypothetical protein
MLPSQLNRLNDLNRADLMRSAREVHLARTASPLHLGLHQTRRPARWLVALARRIDPSVVSLLSNEALTLPSSILPTG